MAKKSASAKNFWSAPSSTALGWASIAMPFVFLLPALYGGIEYKWLTNAGSYDYLFTTTVGIDLCAPFVGLVLCALAMRSRSDLGKIGAVLNILAIGYNVLWIASLSHLKLSGM